MTILTDVVKTHTTNLHIRVSRPLSHSQSKVLFADHELPAGCKCPQCSAGGVQSMQVDGRVTTGQRYTDVVIHSLTVNIGQFKHCNSLVNFFRLGANIFTLDSDEH
jgi:hypothetical protein